MSCGRCLILVAVLITACTCILLAGPVSAGTQDGAVIALHVKARTTKGGTVCTTSKPTTPCSNYVTSWPVGVGADVYLVVARARTTPGITAVSCGIDYAAAYGVGVDVFGFTPCGVTEFAPSGPNGPWPEAGSGSRLLWNSRDNCQRTVIEPDGVHAVAGAFYVYAYSADVFRVTRNNTLESGPELAVADCGGCSTYLPVTSTGTVTFSTGGQADGCNPCLEPCGTEAECLRVPSYISFGQVAVGESAERGFTVTNLSAAVMSGTIFESSSDYEIASGGGSFTLLPQQTRDVLVRFTPLSTQFSECFVFLGTHGAYVRCTGNESPSCGLSVSALEFGTIPLGTTTEGSLRIKAAFYGPVSGNVSLNGDGFSIVSGEGHYELEPDSSHTVTVRFQPTVAGPYSGIIETGDPLCGTVPIRGNGAPLGNQHKAVIALHAVPRGSSVDVCRTSQSGGQAPTSIPCADYTTSVSGNGEYWVYVIIAGVDPQVGIAGATFGVDFAPCARVGADLYSWSWDSCADDYLRGPDWSRPGGGMRVYWSLSANCQRALVPDHSAQGAVAVAGAMSISAYGSDLLAVVPPRDIAGTGLLVTGCDGTVTALAADHGGAIGFDQPGFNPCADSPPTAVAVLGFAASRTPDGAELRWRVTDLESDHADFQVHREVGGSERLPLQGAIAIDGSDYAFLDDDPPPTESRYWLAERSRTGGVTWFGPAVLTPGEPGQLGFRVLSVGPNPFTTASRFAFRTAEPGAVTVRVLDALGREVARPQEGTLPTGKHEVSWDGRTANGEIAPAGVYLYRIETARSTASGKLVLIRGR